MKSVVKERQPDSVLTSRLARSGLRFTPQREHVYDVLLQQRDHPTAELVFLRAKDRMPGLSLATVYNCLEALVRCGLVREVNAGRGATRFCPNMREHGHFLCEECGGAFDINLAGDGKGWVGLPWGFEARSYEIMIRGQCAECAQRGRKREQKGTAT